MTYLEEIAALGEKWGWTFANGIIFVALGIVAISMPVPSTIGLTLGLAVLLLIGGIIHLVHSVELRHQLGATGRFFQSIISIVAGFLMFRYPEGGMFGVALALSFYFFIGAAAKWAFASALRPHAGWGWGVASSVTSFALGFYIVATFPISALWIPGLLLGIDLAIAGLGMIGLSLTARKVHKESLAVTRKHDERPLGRVA